MAETGYILQYGQPALTVQSGSTKYLYDVTGKQLQGWGLDAGGNVAQANFPGGIYATDNSSAYRFFQYNPKGFPVFSLSCANDSSTSQGFAIYCNQWISPASGSATSALYANSYQNTVAGGAFDAACVGYIDIGNRVTGCTSFSGQLVGAYLRNAYASGSAFNPSSLYGAIVQNILGGAGFGAANTVAQAIGLSITGAQLQSGAAGTVTIAKGIQVAGPVQGSGTIGASVLLDLLSASLSTATTNIGLRIARPISAAANFAIQLSATDGSADGGITFGTTAGQSNLYRSAASTLKTDTALIVGTSLRVNGNVGFFNTSPVAKPTVTGAKGGNAALGSLIAALATLGLITDSTTA